MIARYKNQAFKFSTLRLITAVLAGLLLLGGTGCNKAKLVDSHNRSADPSADPSTDDEQAGDDQAQLHDDEGHGMSEEERVAIEPGYMNGSWRVATDEQDEPAVYLDTFQDKGDTEITGSYLMGFAIYERYDGESGDIETARFDGETLTVRWNPTTDREEMFTLKATRVDENTLEGTVTAKRNVQMNIPVTITRQTHE